MQFAEQMVHEHRVISSPRYPLDELWLREVSHRMFERGGVDPARPATRAQPWRPPATSDPSSPKPR